MSSNWVLKDLQANYKLIVRIPMDSIENLYFIHIHYMIIYISFVNIMICLLSC
jgi:heme A synthase